jgi:hypothetical protein
MESALLPTGALYSGQSLGHDENGKKGRNKLFLAPEGSLFLLRESDGRQLWRAYSPIANTQLWMQPEGNRP